MTNESARFAAGGFAVAIRFFATFLTLLAFFAITTRIEAELLDSS